MDGGRIVQVRTNKNVFFAQAAERKKGFSGCNSPEKPQGSSSTSAPIWINKCGILNNVVQ